MTRKQCFAVAGVLAVLAGAGFGVVMIIPPAPGVTKANFNRIREGMAEADVDAIFGKPASSDVTLDDAPDELVAPGKYWGTPQESAYIALLNGRVVGKIWYGMPEETLLEKLRRWLRL